MSKGKKVWTLLITCRLPLPIFIFHYSLFISLDFLEQNAMEKQRKQGLDIANFIKESLVDFQKVLKNRSSKCILPDWGVH